MKQILMVTLAAITCSALVPKASAHAISIGYENAGSGSVNIWLGTYQHFGHHLEGSLQLEGVSVLFGPVINPFTMLTADGVGNQPAGLIDGVTNFYPSTPLGVPGPLTGNPAIWEGFCPACGPVNHWQGVNFSGHSAGIYKFTYVPILNPTAEWDPWNDSLNGTFDLSPVINPTGPGAPEPGTIALMLSGFGSIIYIRRRRSAS